MVKMWRWNKHRVHVEWWRRWHHSWELTWMHHVLLRYWHHLWHLLESLVKAWLLLLLVLKYLRLLLIFVGTLCHLFIFLYLGIMLSTNNDGRLLSLIWHIIAIVKWLLSKLVITIHLCRNILWFLFLNLIN